MKKKKEGKHAVGDLKQSKKLPNDYKSEQNKVAFKNVAMAIFVTVYFILLNMGYQNIIKGIYVVDTKVFALVVLGIAIILFERAFRKDKGELILFGIEMLILSTITLFVPFIYYLNSDMTNVIMIVLIMAYDVYYVSKATILCAKIQSNYNATLSDIKTIVKKEEREEENDDLIIEEETDTLEEKAEKEFKPEPSKEIKVEKASKLEKETKKPVSRTNKTQKEEDKTNTKKTTKTVKKDAEKKEEAPATKAKTTRKTTTAKETKASKTVTKEKEEVSKKTTTRSTKPKTTKTAKKDTEKKEEAPKTESKKTSTTRKTTIKPAAKKTTTKSTTSRKTTKKEEEK